MIEYRRCRRARHNGGIMKKIISLFLALVMCVGCFAALTSCGAPEDAGAEIAVYLGEEVYDFDPSDYYVNSNAEQLMSLLYEPLFRVNSKGKLECAAAEKYTVDEEERKIIIELRESYWSDEIQVKADDFVYAWRNRILDPNRANPAAALFFDIENAIEVKNGSAKLFELGVFASDNYEITITYREGADYKQLLRNLASVAASPVREDIANKADTYWSKSASSIVTNGPFKLEELSVSEKSFSLARNVGYHQRTTVVDYTKNVTPAKLVSFLNGAGAEFSVSYADIAEKTVFYMLDASLADRTANKTSATATDDYSTYSYVFNTDNPLFAIPEVRLALSMSLDRVAMANAAVFAKPAKSFLSAPIADKLYGKELPMTGEQNAAYAQELLATVSAKLEGIPLAFTLTVNADEESIAVANFAKNAWRELGFEVTVNAVKPITTTVHDNDTKENIQIVDSGIQYLVKNAAYGKRDFDVIAVDWQMYSDDAFVSLASFTSFMNGSGADFTNDVYRTNMSGWWSADFDSYMQLAFNASTEAERREALKNAEKILLDSAPIIPLLYNQSFSFLSEDIKGVRIDGFGNFVLTEASQRDYQQYLDKKDEE